MEDPTSLNTSSHLGLWSFPPVSDRFEDSASPVHSVVGSTTRIAGRSPRRSPRLKAKRKKSSLVRSLERQLAYAKAADRDQESSDSDSMSTNSAAPILEIPFVPSPEVAPVTVSSSSSQSSSAPSLASLQASVDLLLASRVLPSSHPSTRNSHLKTLPHSSTSTSSSSSSSFDFSASSMADTLTQHLADAGYGKGPKSKSLSAAGMNPRVVGLLSINPAATLSKGMAMSYDTICSSVSASSPTQGLQLTRSVFAYFLEYGWCPHGVNFRYFEDISFKLGGNALKLHLARVKTAVTDQEPEPVSTFMGFTDNVRRTLANLFHVLDLTYDLCQEVSEALYDGMVELPTSWYDTHNFSNGQPSVDVFQSLLMAVFTFVQDLHFRVGGLKIRSKEDFIEAARKGPDLGLDSTPHAIWQNLNNKILLAPTSHYFTQEWVRAEERASSGKSKKKTKSKSSLSDGNPRHVDPSESKSSSRNGKTRPAGPKSSRMSPGLILNHYGLKLCSSAVFEQCNSCPGAEGCKFSHEPPVAGSDESTKLHDLGLKYPQLKRRPGFSV